VIRSGMRVAVFAGLVAVTVAGCSSSTAGSGQHSVTSAPPTPTASIPPSSAAASSSASSAPRTSGASRPRPRPRHSTTVAHGVVPQCTNDIRVIPGTSQGAAGHIALVLVFNNVSTTTTCELFGYPGVDLVTSSGAIVAHLTRTLRGMAGGEPAGVTAPQPVVLAPGASASALAEASDVPQGGISDCGNYSLLITVPNQFVSVSGGTATLPRCAAEIHPVVPGTSGGMN
jgi:hypothetical protein